MIQSSKYGEVWIVLHEDSLPSLVAEEEARREGPRPVLLAADLPTLRDKPEALVQAVLEAARCWPGSRVQ